MMAAPKRIATHNGTFHADEAFAVYMLKKTKKFANAVVTRTRDEEVINKADVVVDVGGVYEHEKNRFDHHQRGFKGTFDEKHVTPLSSAGLVYKHFGLEVLANMLSWPQSDERLKVLYAKIYDDFVEGFDGIDNGVSQYPNDIKPKYKESTNISSRVARLNPWWNQKSDDLDARFARAVEMVGTEFEDRVMYLGKAWLPARTIVESGLTSRNKHHPSGRIIVFEEFCPWKEHLHRLETEHHIGNDVQPYYVIYPDESGKWRVQAVPKTPESFESRKALPEPWRGLRDNVLSEKSGIEGCVFVHASGFIGGTITKVSALEMATKALAM
ncbi:hypothetical protein HK101_008699 [Irineochytrium annulatum]|nr:hypothetical protein HK101_008699 [Irineochytrium annulatum]